MKEYFGIIEIGEIATKQAIATKENKEKTLLPLKENNVRFVHYPDCQQLIIWLTHPGGSMEAFA